LTSLAIALKKEQALQKDPMTNEEKQFMTEIREHNSSLDSMIADVLNNLAACNEVMGHYEDARLYYEESLHLRKVSDIY
jgi:hypothetical protein